MIEGVTITGDDVDTITLHYVNNNYTASWEGVGAPTDISCTLTITGLTTPAQSVTLAATAINGASGSVPFNQAELDVINFYLQNRTEQFEYCYTCTSTEDITDYEVTNLGTE